MKRLSTAIIFLLAIGGLLISLYLTSHHYAIQAGDVSQPSFCSFGKSFDCDVVTNSKEAKIFDVPISSFGALFYAFLAASALLAALSEGLGKRFFLSGILLAAGLGCLLDLYLLSVLAFRLKTFCILCIATYLINGLIFALTLFFSGEDNPLRPRNAWQFVCQQFRLSFYSPRERSLAASVFVLTMSLAVGAHYLLYFRSLAGEGANRIEMKNQIKAYWEKLPNEERDLFVARSPAKGVAAAPVTVVEFSDFQCPRCHDAAVVLKALLESHRDQVRMVFKNYPLDRSCNAKIQSDMHQKACFFARAAHCAGNYGKFWDMHDILFFQGESIHYGNIGERVEKLGIPRQAFFDCVESNETKQFIAEDITLGNQLGIEGTPTIFINQKRLSGLMPLRVMQALVDLELAKAK